jgi:phosphonate transport system ATP-binding protein
MRDGRIVFDGTPDQLSTGVARDIYGADETFNEAATSTAIPDDHRADDAYAETLLH